MKKLIIAAAMICVASFAQSATMKWKITGITGPDGKSLTGGYVYTFSTKEGTYKSIDTLSAALAACTSLTSFEDILDTSYVNLNGTLSSGSFDSGYMTTAAAGLTENKSGTRLFAVITDTEDITADTKWYVTATSNSGKTPAEAGVGTTDYLVADTASATKSNWKSINVPEPTSAMLLLLGMAGLSLRRRRT